MKVKLKQLEEKNLPPETEESLKNLEKRLTETFPIGVPRRELKRATGILHPRTEANNDALGKGIPGGFRFGGQKIYPVQGIMTRIRSKISVAV